jgi:nickel/cobalt transporter (NicO) family protein
MAKDFQLLMGLALSIGFIHTLIGPDHYVPFIALSKAKNWKLSRTLWITFVSGLGHVIGSIVLGFIGIFLSIAVIKLDIVEAFRGNFASWALISFGFLYAVWGIKKAWRNKPHVHTHTHKDGISHTHTHTHEVEHVHVHEATNKKPVTPWIIFILFVFGPCEPLIPILMYPAAKGSILNVAIVSILFGVSTILTMMGMVAVGYFGLKQLSFKVIEKYGEILAGSAIMFSGLAIKVFGL